VCVCVCVRAPLSRPAWLDLHQLKAAPGAPHLGLPQCSFLMQPKSPPAPACLGPSRHSHYTHAMSSTLKHHVLLAVPALAPAIARKPTPAAARTTPYPSRRSHMERSHLGKHTHTHPRTLLKLWLKESESEWLSMRAEAPSIWVLNSCVPGAAGTDAATAPSSMAWEWPPTLGVPLLLGSCVQSKEWGPKQATDGQRRGTQVAGGGATAV